MADKDTSSENVDSTEDDKVETPGANEAEDENTDTQDEDNSDDEDESNDDSDDSEDEDSDEDENSDDENEDDEEDEADFKKAFSQIKGDTPLEYIPNLEEAYRKSSAEGKRLNSDKKELQDRIDQINEAVAKNPELAKLIMDATGDKAVPANVDPGVLKARQDYNDQVATELEKFLGEHQTLADDETLIDEFMANLADIGKAERKKGRVPDPTKAFKKALGMMDYDDSKDKVVDAAKSSASKPKTPASKKTKTKTDKGLTPEQIAYGKKMGLTEKQMLDAQKKSD